MTAFEFCAVEGLLTITKSYEEQEYACIDKALVTIFRYYRNGLSPPVEVEKLFKNLKNHLYNLRKRVLSYKAVLTDITEDEEQLAMMNLSLLKKRQELYK